MPAEHRVDLERVEAQLVIVKVEAVVERGVEGVACEVGGDLVRVRLGLGLGLGLGSGLG